MKVIAGAFMGRLVTYSVIRCLKRVLGVLDGKRLVLYYYQNGTAKFARVFF